MTVSRWSIRVTMKVNMCCASVMMSSFSPAVRSTSASVIRALNSVLISSPSESPEKLKNSMPGTKPAASLSERDLERAEERSVVSFSWLSAMFSDFEPRLGVFGRVIEYGLMGDGSRSQKFGPIPPASLSEARRYRPPENIAM